MSSPLLSSEQALDDYFTALLDEELGEQDLAPQSQPEPEPALEPMMQSVAEKSYFEEELEEVDLPNLDDVQRLLSQLENSNPVAELDLEEVMEQNTIQIAQAEAPAAVEEIQEWYIEPEVVVEPQALVAEPDVETLEEVEALNGTSLEQELNAEIEVDETPQTQAGRFDLSRWDNAVRADNFQVLYFDVNGVTFAVPLDELGGIHRKGSLNHLIGRPGWYLGLQTNRDAQLDVVDTAKWVMAEKLRDDSYKADYQYIVMLGESMWGLACTKLLGTELLNSEKVRWREQVGKRPWLAGMVKEKMCALVHVEALIAMLNAGLDVKALDK
ncbi:chemotaxis protein CheW [Vibrio fluvialis]|nr:chemotaxis protein CheW [Vibrio fluvialis]